MVPAPPAPPLCRPPESDRAARGRFENAEPWGGVPEGLGSLAVREKSGVVAPGRARSGAVGGKGILRRAPRPGCRELPLDAGAVVSGYRV